MNGVEGWWSLDTQSYRSGAVWGARGKPETVLSYSARGNQGSRGEGKGSLPSIRAKGSEISKLIFDSPLLTRAELT